MVLEITVKSFFYYQSINYFFNLEKNLSEKIPKSCQNYLCNTYKYFFLDYKSRKIIAIGTWNNNIKSVEIDQQQKTH